MGKRTKTKRNQRKGRLGKRPREPRFEPRETSDPDSESEVAIPFIDAPPDAPTQYCGDEPAPDDTGGEFEERDRA